MSMTTLKKVKVVMLPTDKAENCFIKINGYNKISFQRDGYYETQEYLQHKRCSSHHIYFLSDSKTLDERDYCIDNDIVFGPYSKNDILIEYKGKIIATTDTSLSLPNPSKEFIEAYIESYNKGSVIEFVNIEYEWINRKRGIKPIYTLKTDKQNTVTIRRIKDSFTREEVISLIQQFRNEILIEVQKGKVSNFTDNWIKNNL